jgi:hypothetical protein
VRTRDARGLMAMALPPLLALLFEISNSSTNTYSVEPSLPLPQATSWSSRIEPLLPTWCWIMLAVTALAFAAFERWFSHEWYYLFDFDRFKLYPTMVRPLSLPISCDVTPHLILVSWC